MTTPKEAIEQIFAAANTDLDFAKKLLTKNGPDDTTREQMLKTAFPGLDAIAIQLLLAAPVDDLVAFAAYVDAKINRTDDPGELPPLPKQ